MDHISKIKIGLQAYVLKDKAAHNAINNMLETEDEFVARMSSMMKVGAKKLNIRNNPLNKIQFTERGNMIAGPDDEDIETVPVLIAQIEDKSVPYTLIERFCVERHGGILSATETIQPWRYVKRRSHKRKKKISDIKLIIYWSKAKNEWVRTPYHIDEYEGKIRFVDAAIISYNTRPEKKIGVVESENTAYNVPFYHSAPEEALYAPGRGKRVQFKKGPNISQKVGFTRLYVVECTDGTELTFESPLQRGRLVLSMVKKEELQHLVFNWSDLP